MKKANKVYTNGTIITLDADNRVCNCLAIADNKILKAGSDNEVKPYVGENTETINLQGKTILPGFYDSHGHTGMAGKIYAFNVNMCSPPMGDKQTIAQCIDALRKYDTENPGDTPLLGWGFDDTLIEENRHLTRYDLDQVSTQRSVFVAHTSGHLAYVNSVFLQEAGYNKDTPNPKGGVIQRDPKTGEPNGVLEETAFIDLALNNYYSLSNTSTENAMQAIRFISEMYVKQGVTSATDGGLQEIKQVKLYEEAAKNGSLFIRVVINPLLEAMDDFYDLDLKTDLLSMAGVKAFHDGSIQGFTGYLSEPYYTPFQGDAYYRGYPTRSREDLVELVKRVYAKGYQMVVHCNGDAAMDDYLYAICKAQEMYPRDDDRPVIIHAQTARKDQINEMKKLRAVPSFFLLHTYYWGDRHMNIFLGPKRGSNISPAKWALDQGVVFTIHCDTPVTPQTPLLSIWAAVNRKSFNGNSIGENQCIDVLNAIKSYTINAAYQNFEENTKGSLEPGKLADLVILSDNPLECSKEAIKDIKILETIVNGNTVFKAKV